MKNKIIFFCLFGFAFTGISAKAQDTINNGLSRSSMSIIGGINITYPSVTQYKDYSDMLIVPSSSIQIWGGLTYNILFHQTKNSSLGMSFGIGYAQYKYAGTASSIGFGHYPQIQSALQKIDNVEINTGFFVNEKILKKISWFNEIGILGSVQVYRLYPPPVGPNPFWNYYFANHPLTDLTNENNADLYVFYQTGLTINVSKHFSITPMVEFLLFNITNRSNTWNSMFNNNTSEYQINAFNNLRTGITITYNFNKK